MFEKISRRRFLARIRKHPVFVGLAVIWTLLCGLSVLPILLPPEKAQKFSLYPYLPRWDWHVALIGFLVIFAVMIVESYYNFYRSRTAEIETLTSDLKEQTLTARQNSAAYTRRSNEIIKLQQEAIHRTTEIEDLNRRLKQYSDIYGGSDSLPHRVSVLCHDIAAYLKEKGPSPEIPGSLRKHDRVQFVFDTVMPFQQKVFKGYSSQLRHRVTSIRDELAMQGYISGELNKTIDGEYADPEKIAAIGVGLLALAEKARAAQAAQPDRLPIEDHDPKIVPECHWSTVRYQEQIFQERPLRLVNRGGADAKSIQVLEMRNKHGYATFTEIGFIARNEEAYVLPCVTDNDTAPFMRQRDLVHLVDAEWNWLEEEQASMKITIRYENSVGHPFITEGLLVRDRSGNSGFKKLKFYRLPARNANEDL